jgi:hypothetical protein
MQDRAFDKPKKLKFSAERLRQQTGGRTRSPMQNNGAQKHLQFQFIRVKTDTRKEQEYHLAVSLEIRHVFNLKRSLVQAGGFYSDRASC